MLWLNHPKFVRVRDGILDVFSRNEYRFRRTPNVLFLCGGHGSKPRERLAQYIRKRRSDTLVFYAETVWATISKIEQMSALEMEAKLASISDIVMIVVESPGTFAELGAFSLSDDLRRKLLPILDKQYRTGQSFVETGPVLWIDKDSSFRPSIWVDHEGILEAAQEIDSRMDSILPQPTHVANLAESPKHLLFFLCDLAAVFGPCPSSHLAHYVDRILGRQNDSVPMLIGLGQAMGLLRSVHTPEGLDLYYRPLEDGNLAVFHYTKKHLGIPTLRAKALSIMMSIPSAVMALEKCKEAPCS